MLFHNAIYQIKLIFFALKLIYCGRKLIFFAQKVNVFLIFLNNLNFHISKFDIFNKVIFSEAYFRVALEF